MKPEYLIGAVPLLVLAGLIVWLVFDTICRWKERSEAGAYDRGYNTGYEEGKARGRAEAEADAAMNSKPKGRYRGSNNYFIDEPLEILHVNGDVVNLVAEQTFPESDLEYVGADIAQRLLTNRVLDEAAQYTDVRTAEDPLTRSRLISVRLKVVRTTR